MENSHIHHVYSIAQYETRIADLEIETDRLSHTLETQKVAAEEAQAAAFKKTEELGREIQKKVLLFSHLPASNLIDSVLCRQAKSIS